MSKIVATFPGRLQRKDPEFELKDMFLICQKMGKVYHAQ